MPDVILITALADAEQAIEADDARLAAAAAAVRARADDLARRFAVDNRAAIEALRRHLVVFHWAWAKGKRERAAAVLAEPMQCEDVPTIRGAQVAWNLIREVDEAIARERERISRDLSKDWLTLAQDDDVREAVHEATRILSGRDSDVASVRNDSGWGKSHSSAEHVLTSKESLSVI